MAKAKASNQVAKPPPKQVQPVKTGKNGKKEKPRKLAKWADQNEEFFWKETFSPNDYAVLMTVWKKAHRLDTCLFRFLWIRFGWSAIYGLVPVVGDGLECVLSLNLVRHCRKVDGGIGKWATFVMIWRLIFDILVGIIPLLGDLADAGYKSNTRNARHLTRLLCEKNGVDMEGNRIDNKGDIELGNVGGAGDDAGDQPPMTPNQARLAYR